MCESNDKNNNTNKNSVESVGQNRQLDKKHDQIAQKQSIDQNYQPKLRWPDLIAQIFLHAGAVYGLIFQFYTIRFFTLIWCEYSTKECVKSNKFKWSENIKSWIFCLCFSYSFHTHYFKWIRNYSWSSSSFLPQIIQSKHKVSDTSIVLVYNFRTGKIIVAKLFWHFFRCRLFKENVNCQCSVTHTLGPMITEFIINIR